MPATIQDMRALTTLPRAVYIDTNVLYKAYLAGASGSAPTPDELACPLFLRAVMASGACDAWTSLLAVEEACWIPLRSELDPHRPPAVQNRNAFRASQPAAYAAAYAGARAVVDLLMEFIKTCGIQVRGPRVPRPTSRRAERAVCYIVRGLVHLYELEMADYFHIALAKLDGTSAIATLDADYRDVDGIEVYTVP
jgi:hypothetical protein